MLVQRFADPADRVENPFENLIATKVWPALLYDVIPKRFPDALVQRPIPQYRKPPRVGRNQDQRGVGVLMAVQPELLELAFCPSERVDVCVGYNADGDAAGRSIFGGRDGTRNCGALVGRHGLKFTTGGFSAPGCD